MQAYGNPLAWLTMFRALALLGSRELQVTGGIGQQGDSDDDSMATFDTVDLDEYLIDVTEGMDREWDIDDQEAVLTPPGENCSQVGDLRVLEGEGTLDEWLQQQQQQEDMMGHDNGELSKGEKGNGDLKKRKPPDGER